jgi:hypothetical protein
MLGEGYIPVSSQKLIDSAIVLLATSAGTLSSSTSKNVPVLPLAGENLGDSIPILYTTITLLVITHYVTSVVIVTG